MQACMYNQTHINRIPPSAGGCIGRGLVFNVKNGQMSETIHVFRKESSKLLKMHVFRKGFSKQQQTALRSDIPVLTLTGHSYKH